MKNKNNPWKLVYSKRNNHAEILTENLIFIILNLTFFSLLAMFIFVKASDPAIIEEAYAKKIALILDSAKPGMEIALDMSSAIKKKDKDYSGKLVDIQGNLVTVKLRQKGGYSYSFFNDVSLTKYYFYEKDDQGYYKFKVQNKDVEKLASSGGENDG